MFLQNFVADFISAPLWAQIITVFSVLFPFTAIGVLSWRADKLDDAVRKYGESVLKSMSRGKKIG